MWSQRVLEHHGLLYLSMLLQHIPSFLRAVLQLVLRVRVFFLRMRVCLDTRALWTFFSNEQLSFCER
jgi:hypothetical protein